jgi:hypothetical protein
MLIGRIRTCRGCGCDDNHACIVTVHDGEGRPIEDRPCAWVLLDVAEPMGICSACAEELRWDPRAMAEIRPVGEEEDAA